ncbi:hypothetical protein, variant [Phytophthora nicotianae P1569]|uniref:VASt domain-containing protein n=1 Tax=Phytophthora nicotianae P1569 TaxID=1317065 RepID=V9EQZ0_PHYNI|nr:hypothetical protein, variant [Phytophthora nicotianae P1569]
MNTSDLKLPEDLEDVTLSDVAELLGVLDNDASHDLQIGLKEVKPDESNATAKSRPRPKKASNQPSRKRKNKPGYSTQRLRRRKAEAIELSRQIPILEEWLARVKHPRTVDGERGISPQQRKQSSNQWASTALEEFRKRRMAETINRKLKAVLAHQVKLNRALLGVIQDESALSEKKFVFESPPTARTALSSLDNSHALVEQLAQAVPHLYSLSETLFSHKNVPSFGCSMQPGIDVFGGRIIELVARVPVENSLKQVSDVMWQDLNGPCNMPDKSYRYMNERGPDAVAKSFDLTVRCPSRTTATHGLQYLQRFEEEERIVHIRLSKLLLPTEGLQLCSHAWSVISKTTTEKCEVKFYLQLFVERQEGFSAVENDIKFIQEDVLDTWAMKLRSHWQWQQELVTVNTTR